MYVVVSILVNIALAYMVIRSSQKGNAPTKNTPVQKPRRQVVKSIKLIEITPTRKVVKKITPINRRNVVITIDGRKVTNPTPESGGLDLPSAAVPHGGFGFNGRSFGAP